MDQRLSQELDVLNEVYCDELEIKPSNGFVKLKVKCLPLLEDKNIEHHYEFDNPYLYANIELPFDYPTHGPKFYLESTHTKLVTGSGLSDLTEKLGRLTKAMAGEACVLDMIEFIRSWMYSEIAKKNKHFKRRKHLLNDEEMYRYDDDDEELEENLMKKTDITEVTHDRFAAWLNAFRAEMRIKQDRDPAFMRKKLSLTKPSGRMIFNERTKDLTTYYDDERNEDDDEAVDVKQEMDEDLDIDENVFDEEDVDLDDLENESEDEEADVVYD